MPNSVIARVTGLAASPSLGTMAESGDDLDDLGELKALMQRNAEAIQRLRDMVEKLQALLSAPKSSDDNPEQAELGASHPSHQQEG